MNYYTSVLRNYLGFSGRATRKEFWMFTLWNSIIMLVIAVAENLLANTASGSILMVVLWIYVIAVFFPSLGVALRRLHDAGFSGWWILIDLVPFIGAIVLIVMFAQPSKNGGMMAAASSPSSNPTV